MKRAWLKKRTCVPKHYGAQAQKGMYNSSEFHEWVDRSSMIWIPIQK